MFDWLMSLRVRKRVNSYFKARAARLTSIVISKKGKKSFLMLTDFARLPLMLTRIVVLVLKKKSFKGPFEVCILFVFN